MRLEKYSFGVGDRFGRAGTAQLRALLLAREAGIDITPVWNKSHREHSIIGSTPDDTLRAAERAVEASGWRFAYHLDADHISYASVDGFIASCDFFTIDVADRIGRPPDRQAADSFLSFTQHFLGKRVLVDNPDSKPISSESLRAFTGTYLEAIHEAGRIYHKISAVKGEDAFITEISVDEAAAEQTPEDLFFILAAAAMEHIPVQTIAPKWSGRFNKGMDFQGDVSLFEDEFNTALEVIRRGVQEFDLPDNLKLSIHSGSDKFSLYPRIKRALERTGAGLHVKTAGTTWLEEVAGLAAAGGVGWTLVREIYRRALQRVEEICRPYAAVLSLDITALPAANEVDKWSGTVFSHAVRHDPRNPRYNPHLRQLMHVSYGIAAEMGSAFTDVLETDKESVGTYVCENLLDRHIKPVFPPNA